MADEFIVTNTKNIREIVKETIHEQLVEFSKWFESKIIQEDVILSREQTAKILNVSLSTLSRWTKDKKIQSYGIGDRVYYKSNDIKSALIPIN